MTLDNIAPANSAASVTPSDSATFTPTRGIYVAAQGDLKVTMSDGTDITFTDIAAGIIHPISVVAVFSTGTTATGIIALR